MLNAQCSMLNEMAMQQWVNALDQLNIDNSLKIVNCKLKIGASQW